jgi:hypothetical protein
MAQNQYFLLPAEELFMNWAVTFQFLAAVLLKICLLGCDAVVC